MSNYLHVLLLCIALPSIVLATYGVDISNITTVEQFQCLKNNGYEFAIVRVYESSGKIDPNGAQSIINAKNGGIQYVDGYVYPCVQCGKPDSQMLDTVTNLKKQGANFGMLWLVVSGDWGSDVSKNMQFLLGLINQANIMSINWGIFTSSSDWSSIMANRAEFGQPALWYKSLNNDPTFNDFKPFGGWNKPSIKQFSANVKECDVVINKSFY